MTGRTRTHEPRVTTALRLTPELHQRLHAAARDRGISANDLAVLALRDYLRRLIPLDELVLTRPAGER